MTPRKTSACLRSLRNHSIEQAHGLFAPHVNFEPRAKERIRLFGSATTFWLFLWQVLSGNMSCSETVQAALAWLCQQGDVKASPNTAAYCKARGRLEQKALEKVRDAAAANLESRAAPDELFPGRRVRLIDGTGLSMPDTPANQERFPQTKKQKTGCGFPIMHLVAMFSLATGAIVRVAWDTLTVHERTLFHRIWNELKKGDILVADCGFCGYADFWVLLQRGVDCLMPNHQRRSTGQKTLKRLGKGDSLVTWIKTKVRPRWMEHEEWVNMPREMTVRQIKVIVEIEGFRTKKIVLVTTLLDSRLFAKSRFVALYRKRWFAELFLRDIKTSIGMDVLKCKTPEMVIKELTMYLIAYNLIRTLMFEAAQTHGGDPLRISFKRTADALRQWGPLIHAARSDRETCERLTQSLLYYIARLKVPNRPNRTEPRAIKKRKKNYQLLNKPRREFKEIQHRNKYKAGLS